MPGTEANSHTLGVHRHWDQWKEEQVWGRCVGGASGRDGVGRGRAGRAQLQVATEAGRQVSGGVPCDPGPGVVSGSPFVRGQWAGRYRGRLHFTGRETGLRLPAGRVEKQPFPTVPRRKHVRTGRSQPCPLPSAASSLLRAPCLDASWRYPLASLKIQSRGLFLQAAFLEHPQAESIIFLFCAPPAKGPF